MYSTSNPGGKAYLYHRTLKKGCPHLLKYVNKEKNKKASLGANQNGLYNIQANKGKIQVR
jgi:hypothetical protein|tara:strand:+ start:543 stop:722 length:180 start_codon:yes stop_codon:yes gene_type:complete